MIFNNFMPPTLAETLPETSLPFMQHKTSSLCITKRAYKGKKYRKPYEQIREKANGLSCPQMSQIFLLT